MWEHITKLGFTDIAILSAVFGSMAILLARTLLKELKSRDMLGINFFTMGALLLVISPIFYRFHATWLSAGLLALIAFIDTVANYFYFKTFEKTEASVAAPILSLAPVFTFFFGWLILGESVSIFSLFIALLIIVVIIIFLSDFNDYKIFNKITLIPAILSSFLFGISAIPAKFLLTNLNAINAPTLYMFRAGLIALFSLLFFRFSVKDITSKQYRVIFFRSLFVIAQWVLLYYALSLGNAGTTVTIANITPVFVFILGCVFLKEKMSLKKALAALLIIILSFIL